MKGGINTGTWLLPRGIHCVRPACSGFEGADNGRGHDFNRRADAQLSPVCRRVTRPNALQRAELHGQRRAVTRSAWPLLDVTGVRMRGFAVTGTRLSKTSRIATRQGRAEPRPGNCLVPDGTRLARGRDRARARRGAPGWNAVGLQRKAVALGGGRGAGWMCVPRPCVLAIPATPFSDIQPLSVHRSPNVRPWHPKEVERFERTEILRVAFALQNLEISGQLFCRLGPCLHPTVLGARDACPSGLPGGESGHCASQTPAVSREETL